MSRCRDCGSELATDAAFCPSCGTPREVRAAWETCEITWWRGYVKSAFVATPDDVRAEPATSQFFRVKRAEVPIREGAALEAYEALVDRLVAEGWEPIGYGSSWYARVFRRQAWSPSTPPRVEAPPMRLERASIPVVEPAPKHTDVLVPEEAEVTASAAFHPASPVAAHLHVGRRK